MSSYLFTRLSSLILLYRYFLLFKVSCKNTKIILAHHQGNCDDIMHFGPGPRPGIPRESCKIKRGSRASLVWAFRRVDSTSYLSTSSVQVCHGSAGSRTDLTVLSPSSSTRLAIYFGHACQPWLGVCQEVVKTVSWHDGPGVCFQGSAVTTPDPDSRQSLDTVITGGGGIGARLQVQDSRGRGPRGTGHHQQRASIHASWIPSNSSSVHCTTAEYRYKSSRTGT